MTCIVGLVDHGAVYIGGDSAGVSGSYLEVRSDAKVFKTGDFLIGFSTSWRMGQLLRYAFKPPLHAPGMEATEYMATLFVDAVRDCLKAGGFARKESERETGGLFLVGYTGRLFSIDDDYQVGETLDGYSAIGAGKQIALGSLYSTQGLLAEARIKTALAASERWTAWVRAPFTIMSLPAAE